MGVLVSLFIVLPLVELMLLVRLGRVLGVGTTLGFVLAMAIVGAAAAQSQGRRVLRQWQDAIASGRVPEEGIVGGMLGLLGALLLIMPGVLSDLLGLALLIPIVRAPIARLVSAYLQRQLSLGRLRVYGMGAAPQTSRSSSRPGAHTSRASARPGPTHVETEVGHAHYRPSDVIDTQGEEVE